jgi:ABC-type nitrate/sulfonate/bicarbonate transport system permease component
MVRVTPTAAPKEQVWKWGLRALSLCLTAGVWEVLGRVQHNLLFPSFSETLLTLGRMLTQPGLWQALWISNQALVLGFGLALFIGIPLGLALGRWRRVDKTLNPYLNVLLVTPLAALIPLLISLSGLGLASRLVVVFIFALPFIITNTRTGVKQVEPQLIELTRSFGATEPQIWFKVLLPGAWPTILTGLRIGLGRAITGMVLAEFLLSAEGLGRLLLEYQGTFEAASVYAIMLTVVFESLVLLRLVKLAERRFRHATNGVVV